MGMQPRTIVEKIMNALARQSDVPAGGILTAAPDQGVPVAEHVAPASDATSAAAIQLMRQFADRYGLGHFDEPGRRGIEHAVITLKAVGIRAQPRDGDVGAILASGGLMAHTREILSQGGDRTATPRNQARAKMVTTHG
jgi:hypothetical protein